MAGLLFQLQRYSSLMMNHMVERYAPLKFSIDYPYLKGNTVRLPTISNVSFLISILNFGDVWACYFPSQMSNGKNWLLS